MSLRTPAPNVGRFTGIVLGFVVFVCVIMIGGTGYLKYQLDRSEILLAAPDSAVGSDQDLFDRLRRDLGYGGFLGLAQNYALNHDASGFAEMKAHIKAADDIVAHLPDKTPAETRHEVTAIVGTYDDALKKISAPASETNSEFTSADLTPLYASLPILDARVSSANGETRLAAQNHLQFWAMLLTLVSWCSLIIAAACAAGIYLTLRDKHSAPMRALAQSIQNMARGDMRTAIWGTERQDMIGELARAVDIARYHFSHLPDLSLLSDQGPVRLRFEGGSRSLFEAMMKTISRDSENIRDQTLTLTQAMQVQKDTLAQLSTRVEGALHNVLQTGTQGDVQIRQAIHEMVGSAENLKNAHAHAADQLNRLIPTMQDRAQGMAEIAHIAGKQIGQTLQSLASSEAGMKANAEQAKETLNRLFTTADDLGERLFGAINLLQASGKVLAETTQSMQGSFAVSDGNGENIRVTAALDDAALEPLALRLEQIAGQLATMENKIGSYGTETPIAAPDAKMIEELLSSFMQQLTDRIAPKLAALEQNMSTQTVGVVAPAPAFLADLGEKITSLATSLPATLRAHMETDWQRMVARIEAMQDKIEQQKNALLTHTDTLSAQTRDAVLDLGDKISSMASANPTDLRYGLQDDLQSLATKIEQQIHVATERTDMASTTVRQTMLDLSEKIASFGQNLPQDLHRKLQQDWQSLSARMENTNTDFGSALTGRIEPKLALIEQQMRTLTERTEMSTTSLRQTTLEISERLMLIGQKLPQDLQGQLQQDWQRVLAQIEAAHHKLGPAISDQIVPTLVALGQTLTQQSQVTVENGISAIANQTQGSMSDIYGKLSAVQSSIEKLSIPDTFNMPPQAIKQLDNHWYQMAAQIEASRASLDKTISEQVSAKLAGFAQALEMTKQAVETIKAGMAKPQGVPSQGLSQELQKQMDEHWYQMTAQIESSRANLVETIADQIARMESRLAGKAPDALSKSASEYTTQRQIEQQTLILSELVATLGVLDSHMQQIKSEMHATGR